MCSSGRSHSGRPRQRQQQQRDLVAICAGADAPAPRAAVPHWVRRGVDSVAPSAEQHRRDAGQRFDGRVQVERQGLEQLPLGPKAGERGVRVGVRAAHGVELFVDLVRGPLRPRLVFKENERVREQRKKVRLGDLRI